MTTLPQTAQVRLPRPAGSVPALINGALGHGSQNGASANAMTPGDVWRVVRGNLWLICTFLVAFLIIGYAVNRFLEKYYSRYTAEGLVTIQASTSWNPITHQYETTSDFTNLAVEQHTQAMLLMNDSLFTRVLENPGSPIRETSWYHSFEIPVQQANGTVKRILDIASAKRSLHELFLAIPVENSKLVKVDMTYSIPRDTREIVSAIVNQHLELQNLLVSNRQDQQSQALTLMRARQSNHIKDLESVVHEKAAELNINGSNDQNSKISTGDAELSRLVGQQMEFESSLLNAKTQLDDVQEKLRNGIDSSYVENAVNHDSLVLYYKSKIDEADVAIKTQYWLLPDSPDIKKFQATKAVFQDKLEEAKSSVRVTARNEQLSGLQSQALMAQQNLDTVNKKIQTLRDQLGELSVAMSDYTSNSDELTRAREELTLTKQQIDSLSAQVQQSANGVQWSSMPTIPDTPSFPKLSATMTVAGVLGLAVSVAIAFLRELMDTTVRSPRDISRIGNLTLLGMVPHEDDDPQSVGVPLPVVIYQAPTSIMAEGFRQVRTRLQHAASLDTTRSILVTSPSPGDGKSIVASNLAAGLALNGRRILLVDSNFRRPALDKYFSIDNTVGFSDVLGSIDRFDAAVHKTQVPNLDLMSTGPRPSNPTELLESQLLIDFIERALEEYDHIIFDSGPMLLVSETAALAPRVDGVVTVVRARANTRGLLQRLRDNLRMLKAEHLGVVLNAVRSHGGGYYGRNIKTYYEYQTADTN